MNLARSLDAYSYFYVAYWNSRYFFRLWLANTFVPGFLIALSVIELGGPILHVYQPFDHTVMWLRISVAASLLVVASGLVYHHHRLQVRIERHQVVLGALTVVTPDAIKLSSALHTYTAEVRRKATADFAHRILESLIFVLEHERQSGIMSASIVIQDSADSPFLIFDQYPSGLFPRAFCVNCTNSAAGKTLQEPPNTLLYVPCAKFIHGVKLAREATFTPGKKIEYTTTRIVPNVFQPFDPDFPNPQILQSLLCVSIPTDHSRNEVKEKSGFAYSAVLCLSASKRDYLGELDFNAVQVAASLLTMALSP